MSGSKGTIMKFSKNLIRVNAGIVAVFLIVGSGLYLNSYRMNQSTPYAEGSLQYVGYVYAKANDIKNAGECGQDPEFQEPEFLVGCKRHFQK
jgi:hypothetical protein